jgi:hypothetical protein
MDFEIEKWAPGPEEDALSRFRRMATYGEVRQAATYYLTEIRLYDNLEHLHTGDDDNLEIPRFQRLACYAVPGEIEGHDIHVEVIDHEGMRHPLLSGKTFFGYFLACEIAGELARLLYQDNT